MDENIKSIAYLVAVFFVVFLFNYSRISDYAKLVLNLVIMFESLAVTLEYSLIPNYFGIAVFLFSSFYSFNLLSKIRNNRDNIIDTGLFFRNTSKSIKVFFPLIGLILIISDLLISFVYFGNYIGQLDFMVILTGLFWIFLFRIPYRYNKEAEFSFLFINILLSVLLLPKVLILAFPELFSDLLIDTTIVSLLVNPLESSLSLLGFKVRAQDKILYYYDSDSNINSVVVEKSCSGYYSLICFISAFISYVIAENKFSIETKISLTLIGVLISFFSNLLRMIMIILVGIYFGSDELYWTHKNLGWILFTLWIALFWFVIERFSPLRNDY